MDAQSWNERYRAKDLVWSLEPNRFLAEAAAELPPGRALDLAAGEGRNAIWLARRGWRVTAVDWSDVAVARGRDRAADQGVGIDWVVADLEVWEPEPEAFDLAALVYLQIPQRLRTMIWRKAAAALAPGGRLVVVGHDLANLDGGYGGPSSPDVLFTAAEVRSTLEPLLEVEQAGTVLRPVETPEGIRNAIDNLTIAVRHTSTNL